MTIAKLFRVFLFSILFSILVVEATLLHAAVITFDEVASGTIIDTHYSDVTFGCFGPACAGHVFATASPNPNSPPNVIGAQATNAFSTLTAGTVLTFTVAFSSPVNNVSIDAFPIAPAEFPVVPGSAPFLQAFDSLHQLLGQVNYNFGTCDPNTTQCPYHTLSFTGTGIRSIELSTSGTVFGVFDNLVFNTSASSVPEPNSWLMFSSGLAGLAAWRKWRAT